MKKFILNALQYLLFLLIGVVLVYLAFRSIDLKVLIDRILNARYDLIVVSLFFGFFGMIARTYRWQLMIEAMGYNPKALNTYHALMIGYTANYAFPRIGEITRCGVLNRTEKIPGDELIGTVVMERVCDLVMLFVLTIILIFIKIRFFGNFFNEKIFQPLFQKFSWVLDFSILTWVIIVVAVFAAFSLLYIFREKLGSFILVKKAGKLWYGVLDGMKSVFKLKKKLHFIVITLLIWVLYLIMTFFAMKALASTSQLNIIDAFFLLVIGSYGFAAPVQAGIGAYHGIIALGLSLYNISWSDGLAYAVLSHGSQAISIIALGLISMLFLSFRKKVNKAI